MTLFFIPVFFLFQSCQNNSNSTKPKSTIAFYTAFDTNNPDTSTLTESVENTIDNLESDITAFGKLFFGMNREEVKNNNRSPQKLGKYSYNFSYFFNSKNELYALNIYSSPTNSLKYETGVRGKYKNLYKIISIKYEKPSGSLAIPSIFDVMNAGIYWINKWKEGAEWKSALYL